MDKFIPIAEPSITEIEMKYVLDALKSGWVSSLGKYIDLFETNFAKYIGTKYALTTTSGTSALHLVLLSLGIKGGDEVIIPDLTFVATANPVLYLKAKPILVDVEPETWCIDVEKVEKAITRNTKAIIPVHIYGHPADMDQINKIAREHGLFVIEDAAEAHGAEYKGNKVGGLSDAGMFSFYGNKIITTGEGGMITTDNEEVYCRAKYLRDHSMCHEKRYWHTEVGYNYRMTNLQAALGLAQLERIEELIKRKREIFNLYKKSLSKEKGLRLNAEKEWAKNVFWMVSLIIGKDLRISRNKLTKELGERRIDTRPFFYPLSQMPMYETENTNHNAYCLSKRGLCLPSGVNLRRDEIEWISENILDIINSDQK